MCVSNVLYVDTHTYIHNYKRHINRTTRLDIYTSIHRYITTRFTYIQNYKTYIHNSIHMYMTTYIYLHVYINTDI